MSDVTNVYIRANGEWLEIPLRKLAEVEINAIRWRRHRRGWLYRFGIWLTKIGQPPIPDFQPTHRHLKRGTFYEVVVDVGMLQATGTELDECPVTIYRGEDGAWWVRPTEEFNDGRFVAV